MGINYGLDKVRFMNATTVGSLIRARVSLISTEDVPGGLRYKMKLIFELKGQEKPACVAEFIALAYADNSKKNNKTAASNKDQKLDELKRICLSQDLPYSPSVDLIQRIQTSGSRDPVVPPLDSIEDMLIDKTNIALSQMVSMRGKEGESLAKDLRKRAYSLGETIHSVEKNTEGLAREWRDRLLQRLKESGLDINCDDDAVRKEFTVYAEKSDVSEEITRVRSHLEQFEEGLQTKQPIGRKLEFIVQELGREFNTLGSKSLTPTISNLVIEAKVEIEKIREQVMNLE